jgi:hypothetical protein
MRSIKTTSGTAVVLDGDLLAIHEALYHEVTVKKDLNRSYEDMNREIKHLIAQMTAEEQQAYLLDSLFMGQNRYENDLADAYFRKLKKTEEG